MSKTLVNRQDYLPAAAMAAAEPAKQTAAPTKQAAAEQSAAPEATAARCRCRATRNCRSNRAVTGNANSYGATDGVRNPLGTTDITCLRAAFYSADAAFVTIGDSLHGCHWPAGNNCLVARHIATNILCGVGRRDADGSGNAAACRLAASCPAATSAGFSDIRQ
jgi:hypothetical protein